MAGDQWQGASDRGEDAYKRVGANDSNKGLNAGLAAVEVID